MSCASGQVGHPPVRTEATIPGVDTKEFTPRERRELTEYLSRLPAPCASVPGPLARCVSEDQRCSSCVPAARAVAELVREGMTRAQVDERYSHRFDPSSIKSIPTDGSPARGPEDARVMVVEFADFECPFCQQMAPALDGMSEKYRNDVRFVFKFLPLSAHPHSEIAARAAIAADMQSKFWAMHHELFTHAHNLEQSDVEHYAETLGLDMTRFRADMQSPAAAARIAKDRQLADALAVKGTPSIFVDGRECDEPTNIADWVDVELKAVAR